MSVHIMEAFRHIPGIGPHVMEGHFSLQDSEKGNHILPGLWSNTIKPGASITMMMWPDLDVNHPLRGFYTSPPFSPPPRRQAEIMAQQGRSSRIVNAMPPAMRPFMPQPVGPMGRPAPPPPFGLPLMGRPPVIRRPVTVRTASSISTIDEDEMTEAEQKELTFVNFVEELERTKSMTATDVLAKYTQLHDVMGQECMDEWDVDDSSWDSDSDRSSSSGGSVSLAD